MKLIGVKLKNFRGYNNEIIINLDDLTVFVGKNDIGKSTILEALDIFFNDGKTCGKLDSNDSSVFSENNDVMITAVFDDLPEQIVLDASNITSLHNEYLLNADGFLEIKKVYHNAGKAKIFIVANHPRNELCCDLLLKTNTELKRVLDEHNIQCNNRSANPVVRASIWNHFADDLQLETTDIDVTKSDTKSIWTKLEEYLPVYSLFQSDRKNSDEDDEIKDPLQNAVKEIIKDEGLIEQFTGIATVITQKLQEVANRTLEKLREIDHTIADDLNPQIPNIDQLKWADVFKKVSITGDQSIPINKRGSGTKRLILISFFRAEAEKRLSGNNNTSIIYAIEEPETSQHADNQKMLIKAFKELSNTDNTQVILTTHSANIVKELDFSNIRVISEEQNERCIVGVDSQSLTYPSLNEVNYLAFSEATPEYHNELFGYIEAEGQMANYKVDKELIHYIKPGRNEQEIHMDITLTEYIRHQIHHPENDRNILYTYEQLNESIEMMREFISRM